MSKRKGFMRTLSLAAALCITFTAVSSGINAPQADADADNGYGYDFGGHGFEDGSGYDDGDDYDDGSGYDNGDGYNDGSDGYDNGDGYDDGSGYDNGDGNGNGYGYDDGSGQTDNGSSDNENTTSPDDVKTPLTVTDVSKYAEALRDILGKESELKIEISDADTAIREEEKVLKSIKKRTDELDKEIYILNRSMSALEMQISSNKRELERIDEKISDGTERLKKRLRALYLSGADSYTSVLLESDSFYDVLMRMELIKRVAEHDDNIIDELYELQEQYKIKQANLDDQQAELDKQYALFETKKAKLDEIYNSSAQARVLLEEKQKKLKEQEAQFNLEKLKAAQELSGILKQPSGDTPFDEQVAATMVLADAKLAELHERLRERIKDGEEIDDDEPTYTFAWPVPSSFNITSGVGARWGAYHKGIDISGYHGSPLVASETGTVIKTNTTCTHDYGKYESCGCGGGYGNYVIIDHGNGFITLYGHMTRVIAQPGDKVKQGDVIGLMGSTGFSTGSHLHFEIRYDGYIVNPTYYVDLAIDTDSSGFSGTDDVGDDEIIVVEPDKNRKSETVKVE